MKDLMFEGILSLIGILVIGLLEWTAIQKGIDGVSLTVAVAVIALLCPSPVRWLVKMKGVVIEKTGRNGEKVSNPPQEGG